MHALKNKVQLIGNIGQKPEIRINVNGLKTAKITLAINDCYRDGKGQRVKETQWHILILNGRLAEMAENCLDKGNEIAVEGRLTNRTYTGKDGLRRFITEIQVNELLILNNGIDSIVEEPRSNYGLSNHEIHTVVLLRYDLNSFTVADFNEIIA